MNILSVNCKDRVVKDCKGAVNITTCVRFVSFMKRGFKENPVRKSWPLLYCFSSGDSNSSSVCTRYLLIRYSSQCFHVKYMYSLAVEQC